MSLPDRAQVVAIGGGIIGCSTVDHLARPQVDFETLLTAGAALRSRLGARQS